jgi:hypothetical protein
MPSVAARWLTFLRRVLEVPGTGCPDPGYSSFPYSLQAATGSAFLIRKRPLPSLSSQTSYSLIILLSDII